MKLFLFVILLGCSSHKPMRGQEAGLIAGEVNNHIRITAEIDRDLTIENYCFLNLYFRNDSSDWIRLSNVIVKEIKGFPDYHVIRGNDLETWKSSMLLNDELRREEATKSKKALPPEKVRLKLQSLNTSQTGEGSYSLPANLQTQRWLLLQLPGKSTKGTVVLELVFADSSSSIYEVSVSKESL